MCLVWRSRFIVSIVLAVVFCDVFASDAQPIGKVYPRGNHWAVGHLMGKKSTDEEFRSEDAGGDGVTSVTPDEDLQLEGPDKHLLLPPLLYALVRARAASENLRGDTQQIFSAQKLLQHMLTKTRQWQEDDRADKLVAELIQALQIQDESES